MLLIIKGKFVQKYQSFGWKVGVMGEKIVGGLDELMPSLPSATGAKAVSFSKLIIQRSHLHKEGLLAFHTLKQLLLSLYHKLHRHLKFFGCQSRLRRSRKKLFEME
ncbi:unnamed protein product [Lactuca virosa]|uniref:Uncharacterized protein n=1 Tax=Lactuca virosa TaxID=75947 RepID=A0AAU9M8G1_9ASTR|nr:unnamed protein product [Lactuca virosa]